MCNFFSAILTRDGDIHFCESHSHEDTLDRLGWPDNRPLETRGWVRVEVQPDGDGWLPVKVDETSAPAWYTDDAPQYDGLILDTTIRVRPAWAAYEAIRQPAWAAYDAIRQAAWAAYVAIQQPACAAYVAIQQPAWAAYVAIQQAAWAAYVAIQQPAWAAYVAALSTLEGFVPERVT